MMSEKLKKNYISRIITFVLPFLLFSNEINKLKENSSGKIKVFKSNGKIFLQIIKLLGSRYFFNWQDYILRNNINI